MLAFSRRWLRRGILYILTPLAVALVALVLALRLWILPNLDQWRDSIAASISQSAGQKVTLGRLTADWQGWHPQLRIQQLRVYGKDNRPALLLMDVHTELSWTSLLHGELRLAKLAVDDLILSIHRTQDGIIYVAGIAVNQKQDNSAFTDWVLKQRQIRITHATMSWQDDQRRAPILVAREVNFSLDNRGRRHQFRITAIPPALVAHPLDIRGDFTGTSLSRLADWRGTLALKVDQTDLAQWQTWVNMPLGVTRGFGNLDLQLQIAKKQIIAINANTNLHQLSLQFASNLPRLNLIDLSGQVKWKRLGPAQSLDLHQVSLRTDDFLYIAPFDFYLRYAPATTTAAAMGDMKINGVWLQSLARLASYIPLSAAQRDALEQHRPSGRLQQFSMHWQGDLPHPVDYRIQGQFRQLGMTAGGALPGFSGLSGQIDANTAGGNLTLASQHVALNLPRILFEPNVALDTLTAQIKWQKQASDYHFALTQGSFANPDVAGNLFGEYLWHPGQIGTIDLSGSISRGNGKAAYHYLPLAVQQPAYDWIRTNVLDGKVTGVQFHVKGDLAKYPFHNDKNGYLDVNVKIVDGVLQPGPDYPAFNHVNANLHFAGTRMDITADSGKLYDANLRRVSATIPDLFSPDEILNIGGEASGNLTDLIRYANNSPIAGKIDNLTVGATATGSANLKLNLKLPLRHLNQTTLAGILAFNNNTITPAKPLPQLDAVRGKLNFTESAINAQGINLRLLGGPATLSTQSMAGGITRINLQGRLNAPGLSAYADPSLNKLISGSANWQGRIDLLHGRASATDFDSDLQGLSIVLPPPFAKTAASRQQLHLSTRPRNAGETLIDVRYGQIATARMLQVEHGAGSQIERGAIRFDGNAELPNEPGMWITGNLTASDLDGWISQFSGKKNGGNLPDIPAVNLNVNINQLDTFGHRFNNVAIRAKNQGSNWHGNISSPAIQGEVTWTPGQSDSQPGTLNAHFKNLIIPPATAGTVANEQPDTSQWPKLLLNVDELQLGNRRLGKLEVTATPIPGGLNFEHIQLSHSDSKLLMSAVWRPQAMPQTDAKIHFEVSDIGQFLNRFNHADTIKRGQAVIDGQANWNGTPVDMTVASLSGNFSLKASNGQFLKADPGAAKLLGVLSLQSLPRRIALDFRDVFSDGFAFDDISATIRLDRGIIYSNDFQMQGPAATVQMSGAVDINAQTQQLRASISPKLSESVALASSLVGGPVVALGVYAVQKLLKDPFGQAVRFDYTITGPWSDPVVKKAERINDKQNTTHP
ncbi:MAG: YhdP family protein [Sulfuriferula sp.]|nr:YhdP family protein [Sulfuriferula sp.]